MLFPFPVQTLLSRLNKAGYTAYAVGGCVRDTLLGHVPKDWDICTSALPAEMKAVFSGEHVVETGLRHGTLTVVLDHVPYEITTYRTEGGYTDHRHPDQVAFIDRIDQDLSRRDFTINAMACNPQGEILDLFQGRRDLAAGLVRCVGNPETRFNEDALRILRALRFASVLDFEIEESTARAIRKQYPDLKNVSGERIREELLKLLCGPGVGRILRGFPEVFSFLLPPLQPTLDFDQKNPHHLYTVWEHTVRAVETVPPDPVLRFTMLLHDCGKPVSQVMDEKGIGHYPGHQACSARLAEPILASLRFDRASADRIFRLIEAHDIPLSTEKRILLRRLNRFGEKDLRALFEIHRADRIATGTRNPVHAREHMEELNAALDLLLQEKPCFTLKDMKLNGEDLRSLGLQGRIIGETLRHLLNQVMDEKLPNEKPALLDAARDYIRDEKNRKSE